MARSEPSRSLLTSAAVAALAGVGATGLRSGVRRKVCAATAGVALAVAGNEAAGKPVPFLRWSFLRLMIGMKHLTTEWQVGDGREEAAAVYVAEHAIKGDPDDVIRIIDEFARQQSLLINVGDEKGEILDAAVRAARPKRVLELGTYCGYGAMRLARAAGPEALVHTVEFSEANAGIARRIIDHAGLTDRITVVVGTLDDGGMTAIYLSKVAEYAGGELDFVFIDHAKDAYLPDLRTIEEQGWLHPGSVVVADNIKFPGAPNYLAYMREQEGRRWRSQEHETHVEYQSMLKDLVLESTYLG